MKRPLQPYEAHVQYIPQWMCDYNLYGCAVMNCRKVRFRAPVPEYLELSNLAHRWHDRSIRPEDILDHPSLQKQSHCPLEVDICVQDIVNRADIKERPLHHDFTELLKPVAVSERLVPSMAGLWQDETRRRKNKMGDTNPGSTPFGPEELISMSANPRYQSMGGWIHEEEFREMEARLAANEKCDDNNRETSFDAFLGTSDLAENVKTALDSVEDFYPGNIDTSTADSVYFKESAEQETLEISVDEALALSSQADQQYDTDSDPENRSLNEGDAPKPETKQDPLVDSFYDGVFDDLPIIDIAATLEFPAQPDERPRDQNERGHIAPKRQYLETTDHDNLPIKRSRHRVDIDVSNGSLAQNSEKNDKQKSVSFECNLSSHADTPSSTPKSSSSQRTIRPKAHSYTSGLKFPVVKDPNDSLTVMRSSQDDLKKRAESSLPALPKEVSDKASGTESFSEMDSSATVKGSILLDPHLAETLKLVHESFDFTPNASLRCFRFACPASSEITSSMTEYGRPSILYQQPYYSDQMDVPQRPREYGGREFRLESNTIHYLPDFEPTGEMPAIYGAQTPITLDRDRQEEVDRQLRENCTARVWEFAPVPPSRSEVIQWLEHNEAPQEPKQKGDTHSRHVQAKIDLCSQIEGPTQKNTHGFKFSQKGASTSVEHQAQFMSTMSLEVHVNTRGTLFANPEEDEITCMFWCIQSEDEDIEVNSHIPGVHVGMVYHGQGQRPEATISKALNIDVEHEPSELDLINRLVDVVRYHDPDIITGYEVHSASWGYVIERARKKYDFDICEELSRTKSQSHGRFGKDADRWGFDHSSSVRITGRHMFNIWRAMKSELNLLQYTMESVVFHVLHRRIPHYSAQTLTQWHQSGKPRNVLKVVEYFVSRVQMNLEILQANDLTLRTSEQARLLGIDFASVITRGSQFKVESLMFRIAKPENFLLVSPSRKQVGQQNALECLPLVMEPQSDFYTSPLLVLDFQSLYPSVMIAYNYCYSTFLGRAMHWRGRDKMGFTDYKREPRLLELLQGKVNIAPNGMMYAKQEARQSLLAKMLTEILETRVMVKNGMKADKDDKVLQRLLNNRQLALKLIANVTYGYTSASFSGRMPCSEIADSIVQTGRETLEKAIAFIHSIERWGAEVVYGDTDSLFVYLKGRTRDQAFDIGEEIAQAVTDMNPRPIKLKFEKVYHPCVLLAKKRYVGFKYEHRTQKEPEFDAKGIETVRRDGTPAEQKIEEKALKTLFRTADLSQVKSYFQRQCAKIMQGRVSIQDFCFAREVRLGTYSDRGQLPAGAMISTRRMVEDPRSEPQTGERVPYVVVTGAPGSRLIDRCVAPQTLLHDAQLELDAEYYITKNLIPPLERIFNLVGANVRQWYDEMPKVQRIRRVDTSARFGGSELGVTRKTLESYMRSSSCVVCRARLSDAATLVCGECLQQPHIALLDVTSRLQRAEKRVVDLEAVCRSCMGVPAGDEVSCDSLDCSIFYSRTRNAANWRHSQATLEPAARLLEREGDKGLDW